jgi:hypothetical protein
MIAVITILNAQVKILEEQARDRFGRHPDDDPRWYVSAKGRKNYGGVSPNTGAPGKKSAALGLLTRTPTEPERSKGNRHAQTMATRAQLATALLEADRVKRVVSACKRVLADRQGVLGSDHPDIIAWASLAGAYQASGKVPLAVELAVRAGRGARTGSWAPITRGRWPGACDWQTCTTPRADPAPRRALLQDARGSCPPQTRAGSSLRWATSRGESSWLPAPVGESGRRFHGG